MLTVYDLQQHVTVATHTLGGFLDVVITGRGPACGISQIPVVLNVGISDHYLVKWSTTIQKPELVYHTVMRRVWKSFNMEVIDLLNLDLSMSPLCNNIVILDVDTIQL